MVVSAPHIRRSVRVDPSNRPHITRPPNALGQRATDAIIGRSIRAEVEWSIVVEFGVTALALGAVLPASPVRKIAGYERLRGLLVAANIERTVRAGRRGANIGDTLFVEDRLVRPAEGRVDSG
jgi:hypothetical protein